MRLAAGSGELKVRGGAPQEGTHQEYASRCRCAGVLVCTRLSTHDRRLYLSTSQRINPWEYTTSSKTSGRPLIRVSSKKLHGMLRSLWMSIQDLIRDETHGFS